MIDNARRIQWMEEQLNHQLEPSHLAIHDDSEKHRGHEGAKSGAGHFTIEIKSALFEGKSLIDCHRMIYRVLESAIPQEIHALKIKIL